MDKELSVYFDKLESAFKELIDSITTYNPSVRAAEDLLTADDELSHGLEKLAQHQQNHARIVQLRQTADQLDNQIKTTISKLAEARRELLATPWTESPKEIKTVPMSELLSYAQLIGKYTVPPYYRGPSPTEQKDDEQAQATIEAEDVPMSNGITPTQPRGTETPAEEAKSEPKASQEGRGAMWDSLPEGARQWLDQVKNAGWAPWPSQEVLRFHTTALGNIQMQIEAGEDPWKKLSPKQQEEADRREREEQEERRRKQEEELMERAAMEKMRRESIREAAPSGGRIGGPSEDLAGIGLFGNDEEE